MMTDTESQVNNMPHIRQHYGKAPSLLRRFRALFPRVHKSRRSWWQNQWELSVSTYLIQAAFLQTWDSKETLLFSCRAVQWGDSLCPDLPDEQQQGKSEGTYHCVGRCSYRENKRRHMLKEIPKRWIVLPNSIWHRRAVTVKEEKIPSGLLNTQFWKTETSNSFYSRTELQGKGPAASPPSRSPHPPQSLLFSSADVPEWHPAPSVPPAVREPVQGQRLWSRTLAHISLGRQRRKCLSNCLLGSLLNWAGPSSPHPSLPLHH